MQNLVLYSKWSCPLPATLFTLVSAISGSAVVSHYKNHLIVFPIIPCCSEQPVYSVHRGCECVCTVAAKWSLHLPPTFSLSLTLLRCLSLLSPHYKATSLPSNPFLLYISRSPFSFVLFIPSPSTHLSPSFFSPPLPPPPSLYLSLTHYPTAWSNQSAICEWKLPPHTVSLYYIEPSLCL